MVRGFPFAAILLAEISLVITNNWWMAQPATPDSLYTPPAGQIP
jgi:hypothetical protein